MTHANDNQPTLRPAQIRTLNRRLVLAVLVAGSVVFGLAWAGDLEPPGPPAPTMHTLAETPPTWSRILPADDGAIDGCDSTRFECLGPSDTWVLDHQTGLTWRRSVARDERSWSFAHLCTTYGDAGWRLPSLFELASLVVAPPETTTDARGIAEGNPFLGPTVGTDEYWTMTSSGADPTQAWFVLFQNGAIDQIGMAPKSEQKQVWCVRASRPGMSVY